MAPQRASAHAQTALQGLTSQALVCRQVVAVLHVVLGPTPLYWVLSLQVHVSCVMQGPTSQVLVCKQVVAVLHVVLGHTLQLWELISQILAHSVEQVPIATSQEPKTLPTVSYALSVMLSTAQVMPSRPIHAWQEAYPIQ